MKSMETTLGYRLPYFEETPEGSLTPSHHPFTKPMSSIKELEENQLAV